MNAAARQVGVEAAPHRLDDAVERQRQAAPQLDDQGFFPLTDRGGQPMRAGRPAGNIAAGFPARDGARMDAELARQRGMGGGALPHIGVGARRGGAIAASILTAAFHLLKNGTPYEDLGPDHFDKRAQGKQVHRLINRRIGAQHDAHRGPAGADLGDDTCRLIDRAGGGIDVGAPLFWRQQMRAAEMYSGR
jgi:hypothetical protein